MKIQDLLESGAEEDVYLLISKELRSINLLHSQFNELIKILGYDTAIQKITSQLNNADEDWYIIVVSNNSPKLTKLLNKLKLEKQKLIDRMNSGV